MILSVTDANGNTLNHIKTKRRSADAQSVNLINDILSDAAARAPLMVEPRPHRIPRLRRCA